MSNRLIRMFSRLNAGLLFQNKSAARLLPLTGFTSLLDTEIVIDKSGTNFVLLSGAHGDLDYKVQDKTEFEAVNNHVHILDKLSPSELDELKEIAPVLCRCIQYTLQAKYHGRQFYIYATASVHDSFILRFHQHWDDEPPYYSPGLSYGDDMIIFLPPK